MDNIWIWDNPSKSSFTSMKLCLGGFIALLAIITVGLTVPLAAKTIPETNQEALNDPDAQRYYDIYLTNNRVCKRCTSYWVNPRQVRLVNRQGQSVVVKVLDVVGVDKHPRWRRWVESIVEDANLAGEVISPRDYDPLQGFKDSIRLEHDPGAMLEPSE